VIQNSSAIYKIKVKKPENLLTRRGEERRGEERRGESSPAKLDAQVSNKLLIVNIYNPLLAVTTSTIVARMSILLDRILSS